MFWGISFFNYADREPGFSLSSSPEGRHLMTTSIRLAPHVISLDMSACFRLKATPVHLCEEV